MTYGILFPGQGSQAIGMGAEVFDRYPDLATRASEILGFDLVELCLRGTEEELTRTQHAQPALFVVAYGTWLAFTDAIETPPAGAAGHSLGEYTALTAAGAIDFETALHLVSERGKAMAAAASQTASGMAALLGADADVAEQICRDRRDEGGHLWVANLNAPGQTVVAGSAADIDWIVEAARQLGVRRAIPLKVAGAFHSPLMASAVDVLDPLLRAAEFTEPSFPVWSNVDAEPVVDIADALRRQITGSVRFADSLNAMHAAGVDTFVHIGPGDVTAGMAKRAVPDAAVVVVSTPTAVGAVPEL
ncbi:MAG: ACP S-malonyltransferase [Acidimicrobiia bacterium]|nr:ACP S-malonyltransferase [Acidimicrobiia bacterium]